MCQSLTTTDIELLSSIKYKTLLVKLRRTLLNIPFDIGWLANYQLNILLGLTAEILQ